MDNIFRIIHTKWKFLNLCVCCLLVWTIIRSICCAYIKIKNFQRSLAIKYSILSIFTFFCNGILGKYSNSTYHSILESHARCTISNREHIYDYITDQLFEIRCKCLHFFPRGFCNFPGVFVGAGDEQVPGFQVWHLKGAKGWKRRYQWSMDHAVWRELSG